MVISVGDGSEKVRGTEKCHQRVMTREIVPRSAVFKRTLLKKIKEQFVFTMKRN